VRQATEVDTCEVSIWTQMDTYIQAGEESSTNSERARVKRQHRSIAEKRSIVEQTLVPGASVARIARAHGVNANQLFYWRTLYHKGRLGAALLPVKVEPESTRPLSISRTEPRPTKSVYSPSGTIHIDLRHAQVRIDGNADPVVLRVLLECLQR